MSDESLAATEAARTAQLDHEFGEDAAVTDGVDEPTRSADEINAEAEKARVLADAALAKAGEPEEAESTVQPFVLDGDLNLLEVAGAQSFAESILSAGRVAQSFSIEVFDAVVQVMEKNHASARAQNAPEQVLLAIEAQIEVVKAVRHMNRHLHKVNQSLEARARILQPMQPVL